MIALRQQVSLGALALVLCLAFPMGVLSVLSPSTTADQIDAADTVVVARVASMQMTAERSLLVLDVDRVLAGERPEGRQLKLSLEGRPGLEVGDRALLMLTLRPAAILGAYQVAKNERTLEDEVLTPITGMAAYGVMEMVPVPMGQVQRGLRVRMGAAVEALPDGGSQDAAEAADGTALLDADEGQTQGTDGYEPNDDLASATPILLGAPTVLTGMPLCITGLIGANDVDFYSFDGPGLSILHAETVLPEGATGLDLNPILGLFDLFDSSLVAYDEDSGQGNQARLSVPLERAGMGGYAVAVESEPDPDLLFDGSTGTTTGPYELKLELQRATYLTNDLDLILGASEDGTFIEDFIGFKEIGGADLLLAGVPADGWAASYDIQTPGAVTGFFAGTGDFLGEPAFTGEIDLGSFAVGPVVDVNGFNRAGSASSETKALYSTRPDYGLFVSHDYQVSKQQRTVTAQVGLSSVHPARLRDVTYTRLLDVDLFGTGADSFHWNFSESSTAKVFPVDTAADVGDLVVPESSGEVEGDYQVAVLIERGDIARSDGTSEARYDMAYTLIRDIADPDDAVTLAAQNLSAEGASNYVIAVDQDPETGFYTAFGVGIADA